MVADDKAGQTGRGRSETLAEVWEAELKAKERLELIRHKLLVMSGKGGVGKSTVAVYLALGLARRGHAVGLLDVDLHGPDIARMLGLKGRLHMGPEGGIQPQSGPDNLKVVSIEGLLTDRDAPVIWRGPMKHKAIRQFLGEVEWGRLDYLVIDSPPGTGDEPMSVAQVVAGVRAVIVTTPQEVALADVRKAINFCRHVNLAVLGLVENMSCLICPHCGGEIHLFRQGGGRRTAAAMGIPFLGSLPFDLRVMEGGDRGAPLAEAPEASPFSRALAALLDQVEARCRESGEQK
ncbi:MAG: Mrp/NBP35 family ATP-binding protein [Deltaproteobacteria bacterium]|nr:Mrp/NBP35 family ATP-binding protein [Deltaproteobacteria bacterium]